MRKNKKCLNCQSPCDGTVFAPGSEMCSKCFDDFLDLYGVELRNGLSPIEAIKKFTKGKITDITQKVSKDGVDWRKLYRLEKQDIAAKLKCTKQNVYQLHRRGVLKRRLEKVL